MSYIQPFDLEQFLPASAAKMSDAAFHVLAMSRALHTLSITASPILNSIIVLGALLVLNYTLAWIKYHLARRNRSEAQLPPKYPLLVPFLGHAISSACDLEGFLYRATYVFYEYGVQLEVTNLADTVTDISS